MATDSVAETSSSSQGTIIIPSFKTRTPKEWYEFAFEDRSADSGKREASGKCRFCKDRKEVKSKNGYSNFAVHMDKHKTETVLQTVVVPDIIV